MFGRHALGGMAAEHQSQDTDLGAYTTPAPPSATAESSNVSEARNVEPPDQEDMETEEEEDTEPRLKYSRLTSSLASVYRSADSTSAFVVSGDKMVF